MFGSCAAFGAKMCQGTFLLKRGNYMNEIVSNLLVYGSLPEDSILWQLADICVNLKNQTETKAAL